MKPTVPYRVVRGERPTPDAPVTERWASPAMPRDAAQAEAGRLAQAESALPRGRGSWYYRVRPEDYELGADAGDLGTI